MAFILNSSVYLNTGSYFVPDPNTNPLHIMMSFLLFNFKSYMMRSWVPIIEMIVLPFSIIQTKYKDSDGSAHKIDLLAYIVD
jgi:hypothetical protein